MNIYILAEIRFKFLSYSHVFFMFVSNLKYLYYEKILLFLFIVIDGFCHFRCTELYDEIYAN